MLLNKIFIFQWYLAVLIGLLIFQSYNYVSAPGPELDNASLEIYDKALKINPNNVTVLSLKGLLLFNMTKYDAALVWFDKVLAIEPDNLDALTDKGSALHFLGKNQEAITWIDKVLAIEPDNAKAIKVKKMLEQPIK